MVNPYKLRYCLLILQAWVVSSVFSQVASRKTMDALTYEVVDGIERYFKDPLFFASNIYLDEKTRLQFGLKKARETQIKRLHFSPQGDTLLLEFDQRMQCYEGRLDWRLDAEVASISHHEPFGPVMTMSAKIQLPVFTGQSPSLRPAVKIFWSGETIVHVMKWEIGIGFYAESAIRAKIQELLERLQLMFNKNPEHIIGPRGEWDHNPLPDRYAEKNLVVPPEIVQHRNIRIKTRKRKVEDLHLQGDWHTRVLLRPNHGAGGKFLVDFFITIHGDQITQFRFEFVHGQNLPPTLDIARGDLSMNIQDWMEKHGVSEAYLLLLKTDPPYDYVLQIKSDNPNEERSFYLYALSMDHLVVRVLTGYDKGVLVPIYRLKKDK